MYNLLFFNEVEQDVREAKEWYKSKKTGWKNVLRKRLKNQYCEFKKAQKVTN